MRAPLGAHWATHSTTTPIASEGFLTEFHRDKAAQNATGFPPEHATLLLVPPAGSLPIFGAVALPVQYALTTCSPEGHTTLPLEPSTPK